MRKQFLIILAMFAFMVLQAKDIREIWLSMPDSLVMYLDKNKRIEMIDYIDMKVKAEVRNTLEGMSVMDTLTHDFLQVTLSEASTLQMRTLVAEDGDSVFCMVRTFRGPQAESEVFIYGHDWQVVRQLSFSPASIIVQPDTMSDAIFADLMQLMDVLLVEAQLSIEGNTLTLSASPINLNKEEMEKVRPILPSRTLHWNGMDFQ